MADLASAWLGGSQQAIDYAWKRHTANLQLAADQRAQRQFDYEAQEWEKAVAARDAVNAGGMPQYGPGAPTKAQQAPAAAAPPVAPAAPSAPVAAPQAAPTAAPYGEAQTTAQTQTAPAPYVPPTPAVPYEAGFTPEVLQAGRDAQPQQPVFPGRPVPGPSQEEQQQWVANAQAAMQQEAPRLDALMAQAQAANPRLTPAEFDAMAMQQLGYTSSELTAAQAIMAASGVDLQTAIGVARENAQRAAGAQTRPVPAEAVSPQEGMSEPVMPPQVDAPSEPTPEAVNQSLAAFQQRLLKTRNAEEMEREWRLATHAAEVADLASRHPIIGFRARMGNAVIDVPGYAQAYQDYSNLYRRMAVNNGELSRIEAVFNGAGWGVTPTSDGGYTVSSIDPETQLDVRFGISRADAAMIEHLFKIAENDGGTISLEDAEPYMEFLQTVPEIFIWQGQGDDRTLRVDGDRIVLNDKFLAMAQARQDAVGSVKDMIAAGGLAVRQRNAQTRWYNTFNDMVKKYDNEMPEGVAQQLANQYNAITGEAYTAADVQARWAAARYTPAMQEAATVRAIELRANIAREIEEIRQNNRLTLAEKRGAIAERLKRLGASLTPRRGGTGRGAAAGATGAGVSTRQVVTEENLAAFEAMRPVVTSLIARIDNEDDNEMFAKVFAEGTPARAALDAFNKDNVSTNIAGAIPTVRNLQLMRTIHSAITDAGAADLFDFSGEMLRPAVQVGTGRNAVYTTVTPAGGSATGSLRVGHVEDGYRYVGGDPGNQSSWEPI